MLFIGDPDMKKLYTIMLLLMMIPLSSLCGENLEGVSFFEPRSQSVSTSRQMVGWQPLIHKADMSNAYFSFAVMPVYSHSVRRERLAYALFGVTDLSISGSQVTGRSSTDIVADYFGLSPLFQSSVFLDPYIENVMGDIMGYLGLDSITPGLYFWFHMPIVYTKWHLRLREEINSVSINVPFAPGYMDVDAVAPGAASFTQAVRDGAIFGQVVEPIAFGRMDIGRSKSHVSDLQLALGWDFVSNRCGHAGFALLLSAPTGSKTSADILFAPYVGNGRHWELGLGYSGKALLWEKDDEQLLYLHADMRFTHLFKAKQRRSFDLKANGFASRYMLVKEFTSSGQYTGRMVPLINRSTLDCYVRNDYQFDMAFMFGYQYNEFSFDIGYNAWIRARDKISFSSDIPSLLGPTPIGIKGTTNVYTMGMPNNTTQPTAIISDSNNAPIEGPTFIRLCDINKASAESPRVFTHKLFTHLSFTLKKPCWIDATPFIGVGGEIEFEGINLRNIAHFARTTLSQWSLWLKAGFAFE